MGTHHWHHIAASFQASDQKHSEETFHFKWNDFFLVRVTKEGAQSRFLQKKKSIMFVGFVPAHFPSSAS